MKKEQLAKLTARCKIGDTIKVDGVELECRKDNECDDCYFLDKDACCLNKISCCACDRDDNKNVSFIKK